MPGPAGYLPAGWAAQPDGAANGLLGMLDRFAGIVEAALEQVPDKQLLAFLDAIGLTLLPPSPARAPLVFRLAAEAPVDVALAAGSAVAVQRPPTLPSSLQDARRNTGGPTQPTVFATERAVSLVRASLAAVQSVVPEVDAAADHTADLTTGPVLFDGLEQIDHHLYLGHNSLFDIRGPAEIGVQVGVATRDSQGVELIWEYLAADGWMRFEPVIDQTAGLASDGEVLLRKSCGPPLARAAVDEITSYWVRARVSHALPEPGSPASARLPRLDTLRARVALGESDLPLDVAFSDGFTVDTSKDFLPFGRLPEVGSTLLIACDEAFRRVGAEITVSVEPSAGNSVLETGDRRLIWEISTAEGGWAPLSSDPSEQFQGTTTRSFSFFAPDEWSEATVNGDARRWLRIRLAAGDYGKLVATPTELQQPNPPRLARMRVAYAVSSGEERLDHCRSRNRFHATDHSGPARFGRDPFEPFQVVPDRAPAVQLGFSTRLPVGLISLFVDVGVSAEAGAPPRQSPFTWEYRSSEGWSELPVLDETAGFTARGMLQFIGQPDLVADEGPIGPLYWIRGRLKRVTGTPDPLPLAALHLNGVWASARSTVAREAVGHADGSPGQVLELGQRPVLSGELIEVQEWRGTGKDWESLLSEVDVDHLAFDRNAGGEVTSVWVAWEPCGTLHGSGPGDRHYELDRTSGQVRLGDGVYGMAPPVGALMRATYDYGGGAVGNVPTGTIGQLLSAVPYVEDVTNPVAAAGGAVAERVLDVPAALRMPRRTAGGGVWSRGPQAVRHRGRAVSAGDVEWLARTASPEVALARCLTTTGPADVPTAGWITVVVTPWSDDREPQPTVELLQRVRAYLAARVPVAVARQVRIVGPGYQAVSVIGEIAIRDATAAAAVEERLRDALDRFLHPLTGGLHGGGWRFGEPVPLSRVASLVEGTEGVAFARELQLVSGGAVQDERVDIASGRLPAAGRHLLKLAAEG